MAKLLDNPANRLYQMLSTVGDGSGTVNANVNGSVTPVVFKLLPGAGERFELSRMIAEIGDDGGAFSGANYGNITGPLTNGVDVGIYNVSDDSLVLDLCGGLAIDSNRAWGRVAYDNQEVVFGAVSALSVRWSFFKDNHLQRGLIIDENTYFAVTVNDDLTTLTEHYFTLRGLKF